MTLLGCKATENNTSNASFDTKEVSCVITIPAGRSLYSSIEKEHLKELSIDRKFEAKLAELTENKIPVNEIKVPRKQQVGFFNFFYEVSSYKSCEETTKNINSIYFDSYGYSPEYYSIISLK
jgi:hypothetical protein